ncbi:MAG TPA: S4 domain-containing protein [Verrucomicrobiota bacterium]|nr:RNA-binding protein [Verrucomicrobiales bacterium]HRI15135.1 S4 domain-containing protein [Verrucomicrobiota bacterium]
MRLDQWLWAVRVYKTRTQAVEAIKGGHVRVNDQSTKPAREVHPGELIVAKVGLVRRTLRVIASPPSRVAGKLVSQFAEDLTPASEYQAARDSARAAPIVRLRGSGRPTKRERRALDELEL